MHFSPSQRISLRSVLMLSSHLLRAAITQYRDASRKWRHYVSPKHQEISTKLYGVSIILDSSSVDIF